MQILSIFLKLQAVKQSSPGFLAYPVESAEWTGDVVDHPHKPSVWGTRQGMYVIVALGHTSQGVDPQRSPISGSLYMPSPFDAQRPRSARCTRGEGRDCHSSWRSPIVPQFWVLLYLCLHVNDGAVLCRHRVYRFYHAVHIVTARRHA